VVSATGANCFLAPLFGRDHAWGESAVVLQEWNR
jgi:hypothetical protein